MSRLTFKTHFRLFLLFCLPLMIFPCVVSFAETVAFAPPAGTPSWFTAPNDYGVGHSDSYVAFGDFNNDKITDMAVANISGSTGPNDENITILLGSGSGTFSTGGQFNVEEGPISIATADFDQDGNLDLATLTNWKDTVSILLGDGGGSFPTRYDFLLSDRGPYSITVGDFNGDDHPDVATANSDYGSLAGGSFSILLWDGSPDGFGEPTHIQAGYFPMSITAADFDGDGDEDLAVGIWGEIATGSQIEVYKGDNTGNFTLFDDFAIGGAPHHITSGYLNEDRHLDLAVAAGGGTQDAGVTILLGTGTGSFSQILSFPENLYPQSVAIEDLNRDGYEDLVVIGEGGSVLHGNGDGTFQDAIQLPVEIWHDDSVAVSDLNGDGYPDLAVGGNSVVGVLLNVPGFPVEGRPRSIVVSDQFDDDGFQDLAVANWSEVAVLLGNGDGTFGASTYFEVGSYGAHTLALTFFDYYSNQADLVVGSGHPFFGNGHLSVLLGDGSGGFGSVFWHDPTGWVPISFASGDFNSDNYGGDLVTVIRYCDVLMCYSYLKTYLWQYPANFTSGFSSPMISAQLNSVASGYFNSDPDMDLAVTRFGWYWSGVDIFLSNGDGTFSATNSYSLDTYPGFVCTSNIDGDGDYDLAVANTGSDNVSVLLGNGDGTFGDATNFPVGDEPTSIVMEHFNGDSNKDMAVANCISNNVSILLGNGDGTFGDAINFPVGYCPASMVAADFNEDGLLDLATANYDSGNVSILLRIPPGTTDGVLGPAGGTLGDSGSGASINVDPIVLGEYVEVTIDVLDPPPASPPPGFGETTMFVEFNLDPNPSPLPDPGATITLPLENAIAAGTQLPLLKYDPVTDTFTNTGITGTVDESQTTATFHGVTEFSIFLCPEGSDEDNDLVVDEYDDCSGTPSGEVVDADGCSIDQLCPCLDSWKNQGKYVKCVTHTAESFVEDGLITEAEKDMIVSNAAESDCGEKK